MNIDVQGVVIDVVMLMKVCHECEVMNVYMPSWDANKDKMSCGSKLLGMSGDEGNK